MRAICLGRPGYGDTSPAEPLVSVAVRDAREAAAQLGLGRYAVLGVSGGGPFAAALAATAGEEVAALGLAAGLARRDLEPPSDEYDAEVLRLLALAATGRREEAAAGLRASVTAEVGELATVPGLPPYILEVMRDGSRNGWDGFVYDSLAVALGADVDITTISCPTTLVYGDADDAVPPSNGAWYAARIPHAELTVLSGTDHLGTIDAALPGLFASLVSAFRDGAADGSSAVRT